MSSANDEWPPKHPVGAACLLRSLDGDVLMLRPTYRDGWTVPGGIVEHGEQPLEAAFRELQEETGLVRTAGTLAGVTFRSPNEHNPGGVGFLFNVKPLSAGETDTIVVQADEIAEWRLVPASEAPALFADSVSAKVCEAVLRGGSSVLYMEDGHLVS